MKIAIAAFCILQLFIIYAYRQQRTKDEMRSTALEFRISELEKNSAKAESQHAEGNAALQFCVQDADTAYDMFMQANGSKLKNGNYSAPTYAWEEARKIKEQKIAECKALAER